MKVRFIEQPVLAIVQCRFGSTRLPGKALKPFGPYSMLGFLLKRMKAGLDASLFKIVVATTTRPEDRAVAAEAGIHGIEAIRGEEDDVMARYIRCLDAFPAQIVIRITADNPLTCPRSICELVKLMNAKNADYGRCTGYPLGTTADGFSAKVLHRLHGCDLASADREHINKYILDHPDSFALVELSAKGVAAWADLSMTVDTEKEYRAVAGVLRSDDIHPWTMDVYEAARRLDT